MKEQKKKPPVWAVCLIGIAGTFLLTSLIGWLCEAVFGLSTDRIAVLIMFPIFAHIGFWIALIVHLIRKADLRTTRGAVASAQGLRVQHPVYRTIGGDADLTWPRLIAGLVTLPPLGVYFLVAKTRFEKADYYLNGVRTILLGVIVTLLALPMPVLILSEGYDPEDLMLLLYMGFGVLLGLFEIAWGLFLRLCGRRNDRLLHCITVEKITQLDRLAAAMRQNTGAVMKEVRALIDCGLLTDAYYSVREREVIVRGISHRIACKCSGCAGTTVLRENEPRICDYCGAEL